MPRRGTREAKGVARDAAPEELDIAMAIDRMEQAVDWQVKALERRSAERPLSRLRRIEVDPKSRTYREKSLRQRVRRNFWLDGRDKKSAEQG